MAGWPADTKLEKDLRVLVRFIRLYCDHRHGAAAKEYFSLRGLDGRSLGGAPWSSAIPAESSWRTRS